MTFIWTPPEPLNNTAKTRSIYMTELQAAANVRRVEIVQTQLTFINQNIGQRFSLSAIEELKIVVNQLAIDFGYSLGVQDPSLLGRTYVDITKKYDKFVCHYPILNDLRVVLNALMYSSSPIFVSSNWYTSTPPPPNIPLANWEVSVDPWATIPLRTLDITPFNNALAVTDKSIIFMESEYVTKEGPIGGPYFIINNIPSVYYNILQDKNFDENYFYYSVDSGGGHGPGHKTYIYRFKRDGSESITPVFVSIPNPPPYYFPYRLAAVGPEYLYLFGDSVDGSPLLIVNKVTGSYMQSYLSFLNLFSYPLPLSLPEFSYGGGWCYKDGGIWGLYGETVRHYNPYPDGTYYISTAIIQINNVGNVITINDVSTYSYNWINQYDIYLRGAHGYCVGPGPTMGGGIKNITSLGFFYIKGEGYAGPHLPEYPPANRKILCSGSPISGVDYKGDTVLLTTNYDSVENYLLRALPTTIITALSFSITSRSGGRDKISVTWIKKDGAFRYKLKYKQGEFGNWLNGQTIASSSLPNGLYTGLNPASGYYIRADMETGQGLIVGSESYVS